LRREKVEGGIMQPMDILKIIAVAGALLIALYGINRIDARMKAKNQGFGGTTLRALGLVIFIPTLVVLAVVTEFRVEVLAALLGTVAGYVLSQSTSDDQSEGRGGPPRDGGLT
jgi:xanthine/uracil permease